MLTTLMVLRRNLILNYLLVFALSLLICVSSQAGPLGSDVLESLKVKDDSRQKLGPRLRALLETDGSGATMASTAAVQTRQIRTRDSGLVQVYIYIEALGYSIEPILEQMGVDLELINYELGIIQGWVQTARLRELSELPFVSLVDVPNYAVYRTGSVTSDAVSILRADALHALGVTGRGIRVGVLSDGVNNMADAQLTGDLPSSVSVFGSCSIPFESPTCNEGTAMLEIIHDMAPEAELGFCALNTSLEFINCIQTLQSSFGADIMVDDIGFFGEPYFEDGPIAQAVANVASTLIYVSATGNDARDYYEAQFQPTIPAFSGGKEVHNFGLAAGGSDDTGNTLQLTGGQRVEALLQWNDPFNNATNDYELWLMNDSFTQQVPGVISMRVGSSNPYFLLNFTNSGISPINVNLVVVKQSGDDRRLKMFVFGPNPEYVTPQGSVFGHPAVPSAVAVGAINASDSGLDTIASYSSQGPAFIAFPVQEQRQKPDLTAIDGISVTGVGGFSSTTPPPSTFFGTSAAAPHVAGVAALLKSMDSMPSRDVVVNAMKSSAVDLGAPGTDNVYGAGRVDAFAAFQVISSGGGGGGGSGGGGGGGCALRLKSSGFDPLLLALLLLAGLYLSGRKFQV